MTTDGRLLDGKRVLVTGAGGRLGCSLMAVLSREGASIAALDLTLEGAERGAALASGEAYAVVADVTNASQVADAIAQAEGAIGPLDILVNSHGIFPSSLIRDMKVEDWDRVFAVNVRGCMLTCKEVARRWVERHSGGCIINVSSGAGTSARQGAAHYCASKAALNMLTSCLAIELGADNIRVNTVAPGLILDDVVVKGDTTVHPYVQAMLEAIPLGRTGRPENIAEAIAFLASDRSAWTTGELLEINGGSHAGRTHMPLADDAPRIHAGRK
jgi:NAD(P)-dependent dehydrogenase (short-subunit alcohol dehydrogenase family)